MSAPEDPYRPDAGPVASGSGPDSEAAARVAAVEEMEDRWLRVRAELENQRKRHAREVGREREAERERVASAWLPVVDNLELALDHAESDPGSLAVGLRAIRDQAVQVLQNLGYPRDDETGVPFDPARHEVVSVVDDPDAAPGTVVSVLRAGYGELGHQLRPAAVVVSQKQE
jgi:molecular chaperone GrpE